MQDTVAVAPPLSIPPLFILSSPRAGSTLLRHIVDTHPEICSPGELVLGKLCAWLSKVISRTTALSAGVEPEQAQRFVASQVRTILRREIMDRYAREKGKQAWCDKSPDNIGYLDALAEVFPDARYICLHRNCMDVVGSCLEDGRFGFMPELTDYVRRYPENLVRAMVEAWVERTEALLELEASRPEACFRVRYEQLVTAPNDVLVGLFQFVGVRWEPAWLERVFELPHDDGGGDWKIRTSSSITTDRIGGGEWVPRKKVPRRLLDQANRLLAKLGYPELDAAVSSNRAAEPSRAGTARPASEQVREVFEVFLKQRIAERAASLSAISGCFRFELPGAVPEVWTVDLAVPGGEIVPEPREADCIIRIDPAVLLDLVGGAGDVLSAFAQGRIQLQDKRNLAPVLFKLLS